MAIKNIITSVIGTVGYKPRIVYIETEDTLAQVTATGYLNAAKAQGYNFQESDIALIATKTSPSATQVDLSWLDIQKSGTNLSLVPITSPSTVNSVSGTASRISATGSTNVVIDIDAAYTGQNSITTLGTISTGTWQGTRVEVTYGGTGAASFTPYCILTGGSTATGALQTVANTGSSGQILTSQGAGALPTWTTIAGGGDMLLAGVQTVTGAKTFDPNTLIFAGSTSGTTTLNAPAVAGTTTITLPSTTGTLALTSSIPSLPISLANGGTAASLTADNGAVVYSTGSALALLASTATANKLLMSGSSSAPTWSTATYPSTASNIGKILRADGTNWVESTSTFADTYGASQLLFASSTNVVSGLTTANNGVLVTSGTGVPSISSTLPSAVQANITTVGTVTSGTWNGSTVTVPYGGTGNTTFTAYSVLCAGATATGAFQNVSGLGTSGQVLTSGGAGTLPTWQTPGTGGAVDSVTGTADRITITGTAADPIVDIASTYAGQATIVTLGTVSTGTWEATDVALSHGGTNASLVADDGAIVYSTATALALLASTATAGQILQSGASSAPSWSTPTYPSASGTAGKVLRADGTNNVYSTSTFADTYAASSLLYSNGANTVTGLSTKNNAALKTSASGVPEWEALTDGEILVGSAAGTPAAATITAGTGISVVNGNNSITISATASSFTWNEVAGTSQAASVNNGYICQNASATTVTLPATAAVGDIVKIQGSGAGGWILAANTGQTVVINSTQSSTTAGNLTSADRYDYSEVQCIVANTTWVLTSTNSQGITVN